MAGAAAGGGLQTAVMALPAGDPCNTPPDPCLFFSPDSESQVSNVFDVGVNDDPLQVLAFGLRAGEKLTLEMVAGHGGNEFFAPVVIDGLLFEIAYPNNALLVPMSGRFQLRFTGILGELTAICQPTTCCMAQFFPARSNKPTAQELATLLAFQSCTANPISPGAAITTCGDLALAEARVLAAIPPSFIVGSAPPSAPPGLHQPSLAINTATTPNRVYAFVGGAWHLLGDGAGSAAPTPVAITNTFGVFRVNGF